jgi:hemerythrin-like domain-containing protein
MAATTQILRQEHQVIREALNFAEGLSIKLERGEPVSIEVLASVMHFFRLFVEQCHHNKEEEIFFPLLEKRGVSTWGGPLGVMLMEHDRARALIREMSETAEAYRSDGETAGKRWARAAWDYSGLMQEHFGKEEEVLFRIADNILSPEEQTAIAADFEKLEAEKIGSGKHAELEVRMKDLIAQSGRR